MDAYAIIKTVHIISAAILFGTGAGIAFFFLTAHMTGSAEARRFAAHATVRADFMFTAPAVIIGGYGNFGGYIARACMAQQ